MTNRPDSALGTVFTCKCLQSQVLQHSMLQFKI